MSTPPPAHPSQPPHPYGQQPPQTPAQPAYAQPVPPQPGQAPSQPVPPQPGQAPSQPGGPQPSYTQPAPTQPGQPPQQVPPHPGQPPYAQQYGQAPQYAQGAPAYPSAASSYAQPGEPKPASKGNPLALVSIIAGALLLLWQFVFLFLQAGAYASSSYQAIGALGTVSGVVQGILALVALAFGVIGLAQRGKPRVLAGIGTGIGISGLVGVIVGLIFPIIIAASGF
ncbi:hypothetical protein [Microbacterium sp. CJ88]|uniref:hypothetical protein n=1 Tax=Microbacterium sp. CJ88 TaxID=3445672 RepID=UPI003F65A57B